MTNSVGLKTDFQFQLKGIEKSSIFSKLTAIPNNISSAFETAFFNAGNSLFEELTDVEKTEDEDQVERLAAELESSLYAHLPSQIADPHIDRQGLAFVLNGFSTANQKVKPGEKVSLITNQDGDHPCTVNTDWRFTGKPKDMFQGKTVHHGHTDNLIVKVSVNEGNSVWTFYSTKMETKFCARITHKSWLERYQNGLIDPIGPKDVIEAKISYDFYTPPKGKGRPQIRNAKIEEIIDIHKHSGHQYEFVTE